MFAFPPTLISDVPTVYTGTTYTSPSQPVAPYPAYQPVAPPPGIPVSNYIPTVQTVAATTTQTPTGTVTSPVVPRALPPTPPLARDAIEQPKSNKPADNTVAIIVGVIVVVLLWRALT